MPRKDRTDGVKCKVATIYLKAKTEKSMTKAVDQVTNVINQTRLENATVSINWR